MNRPSTWGPHDPAADLQKYVENIRNSSGVEHPTLQPHQEHIAELLKRLPPPEIRVSIERRTP